MDDDNDDDDGDDSNADDDDGDDDYDIQVVTATECAKQCADEPQCHGWSHFAPAKRYLALFWFLFPFFLFSSSSAQILLMLIISHPPDVTSNLR